MNKFIFDEVKENNHRCYITYSGMNVYMITTTLLNFSGSCSRWYKTPDEIFDAYKNDRWCVFDDYTPQQLVDIIWSKKDSNDE
jgi:hypothetical protein